MIKHLFKGEGISIVLHCLLEAEHLLSALERRETLPVSSEAIHLHVPFKRTKAISSSVHKMCRNTTDVWRIVYQ